MQTINRTQHAGSVWVGSLAIALTFFLCPLGSILCKNIGCRFTAIAGGLTCAVSLLLSSYSCSLVLMFFTFSFMYGLGAALIYMASFVTAAKNFRKRQSLAVGVVSVGGSVGVLIFGPFLQFLIDMVGWRGTYRIMSALFCLVCTLGLMFKDRLDGDHENEETTESRNFNDKERSNSDFKDNDIGEEKNNCDKHASDLPASNVEASVKDMKKENKKKTSKLQDFTVFKFPRFTVLVISATFMYFGHYTPALHLVKHCLELGISADSASRLFIFIGLASSLARVVTGRLCDTSRVNAIYVHQFGDLLVGIATIVLPVLKGYTGILLFAVVYGVGDGILITTINSLLLFTVDEKHRAAALGLGSNIFSLALVGGPPLAGFLADTFHGYKWSFTVAGILMLCAGILPFVLVCLKKKESRRVELQCNPTSTNGTPTSVRIIRVSVSSGCP